MITTGENLPRRGNAFSRALGRGALRLMGWKLEGPVPNHPRMVWLGAPHTSNMDGVIAFATLIALGVGASTMIKDSAFKGLFGRFLRWLGAIPINRRSPKGVVEQSIDQFRQNERFILLIAPEGTRHSAPDWKRGYHHVANGAGVPVVAAACNYVTRVIRFSEAMQPTGHFEADHRRVLEFVAQHGHPRHPERLSRPLCELTGRPWTPRQDRD